MSAVLVASTPSLTPWLWLNPLSRPNKTKKSPAPRFHAATKAVRDGLREIHGLFLAAFRDAAEAGAHAILTFMFEWDDAKAAHNLAKHGVLFHEAYEEG